MIFGVLFALAAIALGTREKAALCVNGQTTNFSAMLTVKLQPRTMIDKPHVLKGKMPFIGL